MTVWWWQSFITGVLTACSSYTTTHGISEGCGSSPGLILNKESPLLTPPFPAFSAFFMLLPFLTTTSLWALPFHSWAALPRAPHHNLGVLCNFSWPEHLAEGHTGAGGVRVSLRQRDTGHATGQLWWSLGTCQTCASCRHGTRNGRALLVSASSLFVTGAWPSLLTSWQGCKWDGDFDLEHLEL